MSARTAAFLSLLALLAACGDDRPGTTTSRASATATSTPASSAAPTFDPPKAFSAEPVSVTPDESALVGHGLAYTSMAEGQDSIGRGDPTLTIHAISLGDGQERWQASTPIASGTRLRVDNGFFRLADSGPARLVWAGIHRTEGSGTQQDRFELVAGAVDATTGRQVWSTRQPFTGSGAPEDASVRVVGANEAHAVLSIAYPGGIVTGAVVDARANKVVDTPPGFTPIGLAGGTVVGIRETVSSGTVAQGIDAGSGQVRWTGDERVDDVGAAVVTDDVVRFGSTSFFDARTLLIGTSDGAVRSTLPDRNECAAATPDVVVCFSHQRVHALDTTGKPLWSLPDEVAGRVAPDVTAVHNGLVYARANSGVVLDARTGRDVVTDLDWTPDAVVPGYGVERNQADGLLARRTTA
ncbi:PQQ-binding-like beta-propeller repeat protein [Saccharothrix stipae]